MVTAAVAVASAAATANGSDRRAVGNCCETGSTDACWMGAGRAGSRPFGRKMSSQLVSSGTCPMAFVTGRSGRRAVVAAVALEIESVLQDDNSGNLIDHGT